jgi:hypothetical protein
MSAVESSESLGTEALAKRFRWRATPWIATAGRRVHLQLCAAHGWADSLDIIEGSSPHRMVAAALSQLLVLVKSALARAVKRAMKRHRGRGEAAAEFGNILANSRTHSGNAQAAIVVGSKPQNGA